MSRRGETRPALSLSHLAKEIGGKVLGSDRVELRGLRTLEEAGPGDLSFFSQAAYRAQAEASRAAALMVPPAMVGPAGGGTARPLLVVDDTSLALARLIPLFHPPEPPPRGIHQTAVVGEGCDIDDSAYLGPYVVVGDDCRIESGVALHAHVVLGKRCHIGVGSVLHPHAVLYDETHLGDGVIVHSGAVLGADGFGYATHQGKHVKVPQVGRAVLEDEVEVGANSAVDRALLEETRIGAGSKIDNLVQVGHNVTLGRGCILCGQAGIAGSTQLDDYVVLGGQAGASGHIRLGTGVQVAAKSAVLQSVENGLRVGGIPAVDLREWRRQALMLPRLSEMARRLRSMEKQMASLTAQADEDEVD